MSLEEHWQFFLLFFLGLWIFYANLMTIKNKFEDRMPKWLKIILFIVLGVPFILLDVIFNVIYGTIMFLELPDFKTAHWRFLPTFTERLADRLEEEWSSPDPSWRFHIARFICKYMLEPWDYNHCGLTALRNSTHV